MPDRSDPPPTVSWAPDVVSVNEVVRGLTAGENEVADRQLLVGEPLRHPLIDVLVMTAQQCQTLA